MALTVFSTPTNFFAKNAMPLKVKSNMYKLNNGTFATDTLSITAPPVQGNWFQFLASGQLIRFTFKTNPTGTFDLPLKGTQTYTQYANTLIAILQNKYLIDKYIILEALLQTNSTRIKFTSKNIGKQYNIYNDGGENWNSVLAGGFWTKGFTGHAADPAYSPNFRIWCEMYLEEVYKSNIYTPLPLFEEKPNESGICVFNLNKIAAFLSTKTPTVGQQLRRMTEHNKRFYFKLTEYYGNNPLPHEVVTSPVKRALLAGIDDYSKGLFAIRDVNNAFTSNRFLTHKSRIRKITKEQPEYLTFIASPGQMIEMRTTIYYTDGTSTDHRIYDLANAETNETWIMSTGVKNCSTIRNLINPAKTLKKYTCAISSIINNITVVHPAVTYTIIEENFLDLHIIYKNSFGGYDTERLFGEREPFIPVDKEDYIKPQDIQDTTRKTIYQKLESYQKRQKVSTGAISKAEFEIYLELFLSDDILLVHPNYGYLPIGLTGAKYDWGSTAENTRVHNFEIFNAHKDINYPFVRPVGTTSGTTTPPTGGWNDAELNIVSHERDEATF
jgi:hypothetical protein